MPTRCGPSRLIDRGRLDISSLRLAHVFAVMGAIALGMPAAGQLLDTTLEDLLDRRVTEQVEEDVAQAVEEVVEQQVEQDVAQTVEQVVEQQVESDVIEQIQEEVTGAVEQTLESEIVEAVQEQVESGVVEQIQEEVTGAVEQTLESEIVDTVQEQVESSVVAEIATKVEESVVGQIGEKVLTSVEGEIDDLVDQIDDLAGELDVPGELADTVRGVAEAAGEVVDAAGAAAQTASDNARERFAPELDPLGRTIEGETWIILVPAEHADRIASWGFAIRDRQDLATLNRVLLHVAAPEDRDIAQAALELALDAPGTEVDFNHVYRPGTEPEADGVTAKRAVPAAAATPHLPAPARSIGIVDTAVAVEHESLRDADIVQRDFVQFANERPTAHGTAVASILVGDNARLRAQFRGGRVYAASVFFRDDKGDDATTAASLTVAGEWLAAEGVRVINMSLAGPPNRVLEAAIAALVERGIIVVAAVGNNGPTGEPLYPAAYASVVGVTAVDAAQRVYRYANRGPHVKFAAPGVDIRVARSGGGYRDMTGTSVAAPHAAAVIANTVASRAGATPASVLAELERAAVDLGAKDFDSVFGFGLIEPPTSVTASR